MQWHGICGDHFHLGGMGLWCSFFQKNFGLLHSVDLIPFCKIVHLILCGCQYLVFADDNDVVSFLFVDVVVDRRHKDVLLYSWDAVGGEKAVILFHTHRLSLHPRIGTVNWQGFAAEENNACENEVLVCTQVRANSCLLRESEIDSVFHLRVDDDLVIQNSTDEFRCKSDM